MGIVVDTTTPLNEFNWPDLYSWKGAYPEFAGRYFGGGYTWSDSEFTSTKSSTGASSLTWRPCARPSPAGVARQIQPDTATDLKSEIAPRPRRLTL